MANSGGNNEEVYNVDMLNKDLLETHHYTINSLQEVNDSLKADIKELHNTSVQLVQKTNKLRDDRDKLIEERDELKQERKLLRAERNELKVDIAHFKKGEGNRKKLRLLSVILDEE